MVFLKRLIVIMLVGFISVQICAQPYNTFRKKKYLLLSDTLVLDSLSLVPGSVKFKTFPNLDSIDQPIISYKYHALIFKSKNLIVFL
jgi:hypothetical protein